jgi:hypothetical protein
MKNKWKYRIANAILFVLTLSLAGCWDGCFSGC